MTCIVTEVTPSRANIQGLQLLESCASRWIFDGATHRFLRTPRDAMVWLEAPAVWTEYHQLEIDESRACFAVGLDEAGTRVLRAWLHTDPCPRCGRDGRTTDELQRRVLAWKQRLGARDPRLELNREGGRHPLRPYGGWSHPETSR